MRTSAALLAAAAAAASAPSLATAATPPYYLSPPAELLRALGGALPDAPPACTEAVRRRLTWGVATSAAQIEGAASSGRRTPSVWDAFSASSPSPIAGGATPAVATDHHGRYPSDFQLMQQLGINAHRFSISWSRLVPGGGKGSAVSPEGAAFYQALAREMLSRNITPVATLYHWDLPQSLQQAYGGWSGGGARVVDDFEHYAGAAFAALRGLVRHWLTINEPGVVCDQGYNQGTFAPGVRGGRRAMYACGHNLLLAHARAHARCKRDGCGEVSLAMNIVWAQPADPADALHAQAAQNALDRDSGWFLDPITRGDYPDVLKRAAADAGLPAFSDAEKRALRGSFDFLAVNTYTGYFAYEAPGRPDGFRLNETRSGAMTGSRRQRAEAAAKRAQRQPARPRPPPKEAAAPAASGGEPAAARDVSLLGSVESAEPGALGNVLRYLGRRYGRGVPLWVTEFGAGVPGEHALPRGGLAALDDSATRVSALRQYLEGVCAAAASGEVNVRAVFAWTFLDNFEWLKGYSLDYGLVDVDFAPGGSLRRRPKASAFWFSKFFWRESRRLG